MPSTSPKTLGAYEDCKQVLDRALANGGCRARFPSRAAATAFRARCYRFRTILLKAAESATLPGQLPTTPYDRLYIQIEEGENPALLFRIRRFEGEVEDLHEGPIDDPLAAEAAALKRRLTFD